MEGEFADSEYGEGGTPVEEEDEYFDYDLELQRILAEQYGQRSGSGPRVEGPLSRSMIDLGLSKIGRAGCSTQVAFLTFEASSKNLVDISALRPYIHLTTVILYDNKLQSLLALEDMPYLKILNAEKNSVATMTEVPLLKLTWLQALNLGTNKLRTLEDIQPNILMYLHLAKNMLESVEFFKGEYFPNLLSLELRGNQLSSLEGMELPKLRHLYIAENKLKDLSGISGCPCLELLHARENGIQALTIGPTMGKLEYLNLRDNRIQHFTQTMHLENCPNLKALVLMGNPIAKSKHYTEELVTACLSLRRLDRMILSEIDIVEGRLRRTGRVDGRLGAVEDDPEVVEAQGESPLDVNDNNSLQEDGEAMEK